VNGDRNGLLTDAERDRVDRRLRLLEEKPICDGEELALASAVHRSHYSRDTLVMSSLGVSTLALAIAVVVGSLATNDYVALLLIGYLLLAALLGTVTLIAIRQAVTAEIVRVIVVHRLELKRSRARADAARSAAAASRASRRKLSLRALLGLPSRSRLF